MTRVCSRCGKVLGEKCPLCGGIAETVSTPAALPNPERQLYECRNEDCLLHTFWTGAGGPTHGLCVGCLPHAILERLRGETNAKAADVSKSP